MSSAWSSTLCGCPFLDSLFLTLFLSVCFPDIFFFYLNLELNLFLHVSSGQFSTGTPPTEVSGPLAESTPLTSPPLPFSVQAALLGDMPCAQRSLISAMHSKPTVEGRRGTRAHRAAPGPLRCAPSYIAMLFRSGRTNEAIIHALRGQRGSSALDTVWRQAVRAWHSAGTNGCSFSVIQDLQKCCEVVSHAQLLGPGPHVVAPTHF